MLVETRISAGFVSASSFYGSLIPIFPGSFEKCGSLTFIRPEPGFAYVVQVGASEQR